MGTDVYRGSMGAPVEFDEPRFTSPILTVPDVQRLVGMSLPTVQNWAGQRTSRPKLITTVPNDRRGWPTIPLVGLAEAATLWGMLQLGLPHDEVRAAAAYIFERYDAPHPLAHRHLVTDGFYAYVEEHNGELYRALTKQHAMRQVLDRWLRPLEFQVDDYPVAFRVAQVPGVVIDPRFNAGRMHFERNRRPLFAVAGSLRAGESIEEVAAGYGLTLDEVRAVADELDWLEVAA